MLQGLCDGRRKSLDNWHYWKHALPPILRQNLRHLAPGRARQQRQRDAAMPRAALAFQLLLIIVINSQIPYNQGRLNLNIQT